MTTTFTGIAFSLFATTLLAGGQALAADSMGKDHRMDKAMPAMLHGAGDHHAAGGIKIETDKMGHATLVLSDIKVDKVPDGRVYLTRGADHKTGVELGKLNKFRGTVSFDVPPGVNPADYDSVVIWCKKFDVEIGRGTLDHTMTDKQGDMTMMPDSRMM